MIEYHKYLEKTPEEYIKHRTADWSPPSNACLENPDLMERLMVAGGEFSCQVVPESIGFILFGAAAFLFIALLITMFCFAVMGPLGIIPGGVLTYMFATPVFTLIILPNALNTSNAEVAYRAEAFDTWKVEMTEEWQIKANQNKEIEIELEKCNKKLKCRFSKWFKDTNLGKDLKDLMN